MRFLWYLVFVSAIAMAVAGGVAQASGRDDLITMYCGLATFVISVALNIRDYDTDFRSFFIRLLADSPFHAFRWEQPPITTATANRPFEFVLLDSPELADTPDTAAFAQHLRGQHAVAVVEFANLGKDAILIVPCPIGPHAAYCHLASFVRQGPEEQKHELWKLVGATMERRLNNKPVWLNTAGAGVSWLHVRLDDRPKYYRYAPYRKT